MTKLVINNRSGVELDSLETSLNEFYPYSKEKLGFDQDAAFNFISDPQNGEKVLGNTAYYDPAEFSVTIYVDGRHPKDILRSISHELVHHAQNCRGDLSNLSIAGEQGYAQKDSHLREMEREAYECGNMIFRDWEDGVKAGNNNADTIYERVVKNWGYGMLKESDTKYQRIVKSKHSTMKTRINKTGANKTKAAPFDKGSSSERAKSAPPSAGAALEENGDFKIMNNKMVEEVVRSVLKRMKLEEAEVEENSEELEEGSEEQKLEQEASEPNGDEKLDEVGADCEDDEDTPVVESKKTLKHKLKKARRQNDKKEARRIKKHLNESKTLKKALVERKSNINSKLMEKWFKTRE